jgi:hypothetical protein
MSAEISTILMSALFGLGMAVVAALLTHGPRLLRGETTPPVPAFPPPATDKKLPAFESFERILIKGHMTYMLVGVILLFGAAVLTGGSLVLIIFAPGIIAFIIGRQLMEKLILQRYEMNKRNLANPSR